MEGPNNAQQQMWKGETAFRIKKGTTLPETLQQQFATKTQPKSAPQKVTPQVIQYKPRTRLKEGKQHHQQCRTQQHHTPPQVQLDMDYHILQKYTLEGTTGAEKAHTGSEDMSSLKQHFTYQSRHTTGHTSSDSYLGHRPRHNQLEKDTTQG